QPGGQNWTALIWSNPPNTTLTAPVAGNTYECLYNGTTAFGNAVGSTRIRNPNTGGVQAFPGDSLTLNTNTEIRFKSTAGATVNFSGVGGAPGLILNGGVLNSGDNALFTLGGIIEARALSLSLICPADNGAGAVLPARSFTIPAQLIGSGSILICQA